jgi:branched-chain amino acid transport system substrate-binding protein
VRTARNPKDKTAVSNAMRKLSVATPLGHLNWAKFAIPNVVNTPIIGDQWVKAKSGKFKLDLPITEHADDPRVPIQAKLKPYNS